MKLFTQTASILATVFLPCFLLAQTHVSCEWSQVMSTGDGGDRGGSSPGLGGTVVTGNYNEQISVTRLTASGQVLWNYLHPPTSAPAGGLRVEVDPYGSLAVLALQQIDSAGYEAMVLKIDSIGLLEWAASYTNSYNDIPVDLDFDTDNNTYVVIASLNAYDNYDYRLVKYDSSGAMIWDTYYNYAGLEDIPVSVYVKPSGDIVVCGASQDSTGLYQFTTVRFDDSGTLIDANRVSSSPGTPEQATSACQDAAGNLYMTGRSGLTGTNTNIKIVKLNTSNAVDWTAEYDAYGYDDIGADIEVDSDGNIIVSGQVTSEAMYQGSIVMKYDSSGSLMWRSEISSADGTVDNLPQTLSVGDDGKISIVMSEVDNSMQSVNSTIRQYRDDGQLLWGRTLGTTGTKPRSMSSGSDGSVIVTAVEPDSTMSTSNFTTLVMDSSVVYDADSLALFKQHELVVRFDRNAIDLSHIDEAVDKGIDFADLSYFLTDEAMGAIDTALTSYCAPSSRGHNACGIKAVRIFKSMRTSDTLTFTKSGDSLNIPDFYTMLLLKLPGDFDLWGTHEAFETVPRYVAYSEPNFIVHTHSYPNDPTYIYQSNLHDDSITHMYPNGNVNADTAWNIYPMAGSKSVKVGIIDEGINFRHEELGYVSSQPNSGKVVAGWSYLTDQNLKTLSNPDDGHGTPVAGIIGARRNDGYGMAGIAGGDVEADDSSGVSLYGVKVLQATDSNEFFFNPITYVYDAFFNTCVANTDQGIPSPNRYNVDIINCSWGVTNEWQYWSDTNYAALRESVKFASDAGIPVIASHGNTPAQERTFYPSNLRDNWVMSVGGSDTDGDYYAHQGFKACWGGNLDVVAPMSQQLVISLKDSMSGRIGFEGTSASAPHVTGAVALMMSYYYPQGNPYQILAPEDYEALIQLSATDVNDSGYDTLTGFGRLNIGAALRYLQAPEYQVVHYGSTNLSNSMTSYTTTVVDVHVPVYTLETFQLNYNTNPPDNNWYHAGNYLVDVYKLEYTVEHTIPAGYEIVAGWPRHSSSQSFSALSDSIIDPNRFIELNMFDGDSARLTAYTYRIFDTTGTFLTWWPVVPNAVRGEYTLLLHENTLGLSEVVTNSGARLFPNPTTGQHTLQLNELNDGKVSIDLYAIDGRFIRNVYHDFTTSGKISLCFNVNSLPSGVYMYSIIDGSENEVIRFVKE